MKKYTPITFQPQYVPVKEDWHGVYKRLLKEFDDKLAIRLDKMREEATDQHAIELIALYEKQAKILREATDYCYKYRNGEIPLKLKSVDKYFLDILARASRAFEAPEDIENKEQLALLSQEIPGEAMRKWFELKKALVFFAIAVAFVGVALLMLINPAFLMFQIPVFVGGAIFHRQVTESAAYSIQTERMKNAITHSPGFFVPPQVSNESVDNELVQAYSTDSMSYV